MYNKRSLNIVIIFLIFTLFIIIQSFSVTRKALGDQSKVVIEKDSETEVEILNYYAIEKSKPTLNINASLLKIVNNKNLFFDKPEGFFIDEDDQRVFYKGERGSYKGSLKELKLYGEVSLKSKKSDHESEKLSYDGIKKKISASGEVRSEVRDIKTSDQILIESDKMTSWMDKGESFFTGNVRGRVKRKRIYEESFDFSSEELEVNQLKSRIILSKNVNLDRNNYHLESQKAEIFLENYNKKLKYYVLYDDIKLVEKLEVKGKKQLRRAFSEKLEGYMAEGRIVLTGAPRVESGADLIKGYQITLRENVELVEVDDAQSSFELERK